MEEVIHGPDEFKNDEEVIEGLKPLWSNKNISKRFKTKPKFVTAIQFNGNSNKADVEKFAGGRMKAELESETAYLAGEGAPVFSLWLSAKEQIFKGDWLVCGAHGEYSVMTDEGFRANYEEA